MSWAGGLFSWVCSVAQILSKVKPHFLRNLFGNWTYSTVHVKCMCDQCSSLLVGWTPSFLSFIMAGSHLGFGLLHSVRGDDGQWFGVTRGTCDVRETILTGKLIVSLSFIM